MKVVTKKMNHYIQKLATRVGMKSYRDTFIFHQFSRWVQMLRKPGILTMLLADNSMRLDKTYGMKIFFIHVLDMQANIGGSIRVRELARSLADLGTEVEVISPLSATPNPDAPYTVRAFGLTRRSAIARNLLYEVLLLGYLLTRRQVWNRTAAIYIRRAQLLLTPLLVARLFRLPSAVEENSYSHDYFEKGGESLKIRLRNRLQDLLQQFNYVPTDKVVGVSVGQLEFFKARFNLSDDKLEMVPNGIDISLFQPLDKGECRRELGLDPKASYLCYIGSFYKARGVHYLIQALPQLLKTHPNVKVLLVGGGDEETNLKALASELGVTDSVVFAGVVPYERVPVYISASDICVAPYDRTYTKTTLSPLKLYNYMACGRPLVMADIPVDLDEADKQRMMRTYRHEDIEDLADTTRQLLNAPDLLQEMGRNARAAAQKHSWEQSARKIVEILSNR
jgi:glycosyltransferase involved in cell wall biosynthesis